MKTTANFYVPADTVLGEAAKAQPYAAVVITTDPNGKMKVASSHSTPITKAMIRQAIPYIDGLD